MTHMEFIDPLGSEDHKFKQESISSLPPQVLSAPTHTQANTHSQVQPSDRLNFVAACGERGPKSKQVELKGGF